MTKRPAFFINSTLYVRGFLMFDGKSIIVTGASGGIGVPLVRRLLLNGAKVVAVDSDPNGEVKLKDAIRDTTGLIYHHSKIENEAACRAILGKETKIYGLAHLAGIFEPDNMKPGDVENIYDPVMKQTLGMFTRFILLFVKLCLERNRHESCLLVHWPFREGHLDIPHTAQQKEPWLGWPAHWPERRPLKSLLMLSHLDL